MDKRDHMGKVPNLFNSLSCPENRRAATRKLLHQSTDATGPFWIEVVRRLVDQQHRWLYQQRARYRQTLLHAVRVMANSNVRCLGQTDCLEQLAPAPLCGAQAKAVQPGEKKQILKTADPKVERCDPRTV